MSLAHRVLLGFVLSFSVLASALLADEPPGERAAEGDDDVDARAEFLFRQRAFPMDHVPMGARIRALREAELFEREQRHALSPDAAGKWSGLGPAPIVKGQLGLQPFARDMSGRVATIAIDPKNASHWLVGAAQGGIWESTDAGATWSPRTDDQASLAMGAIAFAPSNPQIVYAGTGEASMTADAYAGAGLLKSTDGGTTWKLAAAQPFVAATFSDIAVDPSNPDVAYAATVFGRAGRGPDIPPATPSRGVFRTTDGGTTWGSLLGGDASDLKVHPNDFTRMYAGIGNKFLVNDSSGVWRTKDGKTFTQLRGPWKTDTPDRIGRVEIAIAPSKPDVVYVSIQDQKNSQLLGLWRTDAAWADPEPAWTKVETKDTNGVDDDGVTPVLGYCQKQCSYDHVLLVDLVDPDTLYAGGIGLWKCQTCRATDARWTEVSKTGTTPTAPVDKDRGIHVDQHALAWIKQKGSTGPAGFDGRSLPAVEGIPSGNPLVGDFNGDGKLDVVFFDRVADKNRGVLVTWLGNGDGTFRALASQIVFDGEAGVVPLGGAVADLDGDGKLDVVVEMQGKGVALFSGKGDGTFQSRRDLATSAYPLYIGTVDLNGDGKPDVVFLEVVNSETGAGANAIRILYGDGHGAFPITRTLNLPFAPLSFVAADFNGDGTVDIVTANYGGDLGPACNGESGSTGTVTLLAAKPDGSFPSYTTLLSGPQIRNIAAGDFTGDGKLDLAVTRGTGKGQEVVVLPGNGDGTFKSCQVISLRDKLAFAIPGPLLAADLNGDCLTDLVTFFCEELVVVNGMPQGTRALEMYVLVNNGDGTMTKTTTTLSLCTIGAALGDVNGDGRPDVVIGGFLDGPPVVSAVSLYTNKSTASCGGKLVAGNDGGVWSSTDGGGSWADHNTNLSITQFYGGSLHPRNPDFALGSSQDNGTQKYTGAPGWPWIDFGDGAESFISIGRSDTDWAVSRPQLTILRTRNGSTFTDAYTGIPKAQRDKALFIGRFAQCPKVDEIVIAGAEHVFRTNDFFSGTTVTWTDLGGGVTGHSISALAFAPSDGACGTYAYGTDEGALGISSNGGATWKDADPAKGVPDRWVTDVAFDPSDPKTLYVTVSGFDEGTPGAPGHLFKTTNAFDAAPSWTRIGPPVNIPFNSVAVDPKDGRNVYLGTDVGVFVSVDAGATWARMGPDTGMPNVAVFEVRFGQETGRVGAFTHGRGAFLLAPGLRSADLSVTKRHDPASVLVGKNVTYTLVVANGGPDDATTVTLTDTLPAGVSFVSVATSQGACSGTSTVSCGLGALRSGASATVTIVVTANAAGTLTNTARVSANESDPNPANNTAFDSIQVGALTITKLTPSSAPQGTRNLALVVEGTGFVPATVVSFQPSTGIEVVPPAPPDYGFVSSTEIHRVINIAADAPLGERELSVTNPDGSAGGIRPFDVFTVTPGAIPRIDVSPASLDFGSAPSGQSVDRTLTVRDVGTGILTVRAIGATDPAFRVISPSTPFSLAAGAQQTVTIRFSPRTSGAVTGILVIASNDPSRASVQVALSGTGSSAAKGTIGASPGGLHFGTVAVGQTRSSSLTVRNTGSGTLSVASPTVDNARFAVSPSGAFSLASGQSRSFTVSFSPASTGSQSSSLTFASDDPVRPSLTVSLRGDGGAAASTEELATDDGTVEIGTVSDGLAVVNRLTPSAYPATLQKIRPFFVQFQSRPNPSGQSIRLIAWVEPSGSGPSSQTPQLLVDVPVTIPSVPASGAFFEYTIPNPPTASSGDFYVGYIAPSPNAGVGFAADSTGVQRNRGFFSTDGGRTFVGPLVLNSGSGQTPVNMMIRATVQSGSAGSSCTYEATATPSSFGGGGGAGTVSIVAPAGCPWNASSASSFVSITGVSSGTGNGSTSFTVASNGGSSPRAGSIGVAGLGVSIGQDGAVGSGGGSLVDETVFVPIVLSTAGLNGSFFTSELTLTNRGSTPAVVKTVYTAAFGGGTGSSYDVIAPGAQTIQSDGISYLRSIGSPLPDSGNRGGTLSLQFSGLSSPSAGAATVRTTTSVPEGRAGLAYPGVTRGLVETSYLCGLRQTDQDRSNVALLNAGSASDGDVTLRLTVYSGDPAAPIAVTLPDVSLPPGGFTQLSGVLGSNGLAISNGFVRVERVAGNAPYYAYAVINDQKNSDGSFVPAFPASALAGKRGITLPVIVETSTFSSELVATNFGATPRVLFFSYVADAVQGQGNEALFTLNLRPSEQRVVPNLVQYLRDQGVPGVGTGTFAGALFATVDGGGDVSGLFLGARTSAPGGGGRYGLFYAGVPYGAAAVRSAWLFGLQQNAESRTNLALVNTGESDGSADVFKIDLYDGDTGALVKTIDGVSVGARRFTQLTTVLAQYASGTTNAYAKVTRTSGNNPFVTYAVVNDGGQPGQRSGDGAFVPMSTVDEGP